MVLAIAIVISGIAMLLLADQVSAFLERNRKYEVLGLFILLIVAVMLLGEGGHEAHLTLFGLRCRAALEGDVLFLDSNACGGRHYSVRLSAQAGCDPLSRKRRKRVSITRCASLDTRISAAARNKKNAI